VTPARKPSIGLLVVRVAVITILAALLTFAVTLFFGITGIVLVDMLRGGGINLAAAYRHVALPIAVAALVIALIATLVTEIKHYRRALAAARAGYSRAA
jgi:hypothetical protein